MALLRQEGSWLRAVARSIVFLAQLGFSMLVPAVACAAGALWAQEHWGWGGWVWPAAILLGLFLCGQAFVQFARLMQREARRDDAQKSAPTQKGAHDAPPRPPAGG